MCRQAGIASTGLKRKVIERLVIERRPKRFCKPEAKQPGGEKPAPNVAVSQAIGLSPAPLEHERDGLTWKGGSRSRALSQSWEPLAEDVPKIASQIASPNVSPRVSPIASPNVSPRNDKAPRPRSLKTNWDLQVATT